MCCELATRRRIESIYGVQAFLGTICAASQGTKAPNVPRPRDASLLEML